MVTSDEKAGSSQTSLTVIARAMRYLWPKGNQAFRVRVVLALLILVLSKIAAVTAPIFYSIAVDRLSADTTSVEIGFLVGALGLVLAYGFVRLATVGFQELRDAIFAKVAKRALRNLAYEVFTHIHALSLRFHITRKTGSLSLVIERGVKAIEFLLRFMLFSIVPLFLELGFIAGYLFFKLDYRYFLVILATIVLYVLFTFKITEWRVRIRQRMNERNADANQKAIDSMLNFETVKYFGAEMREAIRYDRGMEAYEAASLQTAYSLTMLNFGQALLINSGLIVALIMAGLGVQSGALSIGEFVLVATYMLQVTMPLNFLGTVYREIRQALTDMGDLFMLLAQPIEIKDKLGASDLEVKEGQIRFEDVHFGYEKDHAILKGVSFTLHAGQKLAIVGGSGSGKSTIGRLLFRFYDVSQGRILIDGQDIREITQKSLHETIGVVPQDTVLFNDTIGYNIGYGRPEATPADIMAVARAVRLDHFIEALPLGLDTTVGERGLKLSGGEKQRVGIARIFLKDPPILLLDEATSALDTETEREIQARLSEIGQGRGIIAIAHRLSTIMDADQILVLEAGQIVEQGTHEMLLAKRGRYANMWQQQSSEEEEQAF